MLTCSFALHHVPCTVAQRSTAPNIIAILNGVGRGWWAVDRPRLDPDTPILKSTLGLSPLSSDGPSKPIRGIVRMGVGVEPLTVLHGIGESVVGWQPVHDALSKDYDVIAVDLPGFGRSPSLPPGVAPTAAALADAVERELDRAGVSRFPVAGYSLGARVALELATRGRTHSVIAIAPDGLGTPLERVHQAAALLSGRALAMLLAPNATQVAATGAGRSLFFAMERSRPWQLPAADARQLLLDFAQAPGSTG